MIASRKQLSTTQNDLDFYTNRCDGGDSQIDALGDVLYQPAPRLRPAGALTSAEIKMVEGVHL